MKKIIIILLLAMSFIAAKERQIQKVTDVIDYKYDIVFENGQRLLLIVFKSSQKVRLYEHRIHLFEYKENVFVLTSPKGSLECIIDGEIFIINYNFKVQGL